MRRTGWLLIGVAFAFGGSCSHDRAGVGARTPSAELRALDGESQVMAESSAGLTLVIDGAVGDEIAGTSGALIPVKVRIDNRSGAALVVRTSNFALAGSSGQRYPALVPEDIAAVLPPLPPLAVAPTFMAHAGDPPIVATHGPSGVVPVPALSRFETSFPENWAHLKTFHGDPAGRMARVRTELLPEGALANGESASGLLYFPNVAGRERAVALRADFVESDGTAVAQALIPMRVVR
jgi:hypothetical protein